MVCSGLWELRLDGVEVDVSRFESADEIDRKGHWLWLVELDKKEVSGMPLCITDSRSWDALIHRAEQIPPGRAVAVGAWNLIGGSVEPWSIL